MGLRLSSNILSGGVTTSSNWRVKAAKNYLFLWKLDEVLLNLSWQNQTLWVTWPSEDFMHHSTGSLSRIRVLHTWHSYLAYILCLHTWHPYLVLYLAYILGLDSWPACLAYILCLHTWTSVAFSGLHAPFHRPSIQDARIMGLFRACCFKPEYSRSETASPSSLGGKKDKKILSCSYLILKRKVAILLRETTSFYHFQHCFHSKISNEIRIIRNTNKTRFHNLWL